MKKILTLVFFVFLSFSYAFSQDNFKWEKVGDVTKTKDQIYSDAKMFIAKNWKSAKDVIQNDDKEGGIILLKGISIQSLYFQANDHKWTYSYTINFLMKEGKYKIILDDVTCISAYCGYNQWPLIQPCDTCEFPGMFKVSVNKERYFEIQRNLKSELQRIIDSFENQISSASVINDKW